MYTYSVFLPHFFIWFRCKASILTRNIFFLLMSQSLFSRSAQKRTSTPGKERSGNHDFKQFNWVKAQNSNDPCDANSPGFQKEVRWNGDYGGFGQCWHVSTGWAGHIWQGFLSHTLWLSSPVSSSNYCCHPQRLHLSLTAAHYLQSKKKKKKVWAQPDLPLSSGQSCALCHKTGLEEWGWNPMFVFFSSSTLKYIWEILNIFI